MNYDLQFTDEFVSDVLKLRENEPKCYAKIKKFLKELREHPRFGTGHPERLKYFSPETWSREINKKHRLVYEIHEDIILIVMLSAYGHYSDK